MATGMMSRLAFHKHPARRRSATHRYARYTSLDGRYAWERAVYLGTARVPDICRALLRDGEGKGWRILSQHRTPHAAQQACRRHAPEIGAEDKG